ncbi:MAG: molybdopterin-dependent oxidoreductase, partial [Chloroflexota bacterium]|nr:molybdopterin-dependent oxidoreductase [Chloroflexota bacterium]
LLPGALAIFQGPHMSARGRTAASLLSGLVTGIVAALLMTTVLLLLRTLFGLPTPAELVGDRFAPLIPARDFGGLISWAGGYNELKQLGVGSVLLGQLVTGAVGGMIYAWLRDRSARRTDDRAWHHRPAIRFLIGFVALLWVVALLVLWPVLPTNFAGLPPGPAMVATIVTLLLDFTIFGVALALLLGMWRPTAGLRPGAADHLDAKPGGTHVARRGILTGGLGLLLLVLSGGLLRRLSDDATFAYDGLQVRGPDIEPITPNDRFYVVTKNVIDPDVVPGLWNLTVDGHVSRPVSYSMADIMNLPAVDQEQTLMCISNPISGGLMSNAVWRGVPLASVIEAAGVRPGTIEVLCRSVDGYTDSFSIEKALEPTTLLAYHMNGELLPRRHGYPVRLLVPGLYGEKSVKWITHIELLPHEVDGFYEQQGWGPDFTIPTRSRFDGPDFRQPVQVRRPIRLNGTAFGGDRGVAKVEVTVDGGATWRPARLDYPGSRLTWALWSFDWTPQRTGDLRLAVRATDGMGMVQTDRGRGVVPEGATGHHVVTAMVRA